MCSRPSTDPSALPFLIVQAGTTLPALRPRHGDFPEWFRRGLGVARGAVTILRVDTGARLPEPALFRGVVVTGSGAMVSDRLDWSEATAAWLRTAVDAGVPVLGVCYGHQLLAHALGGRVDDHPDGREVGTVEIETLPAAAEDPLFAKAPARFRAHATHSQSVLELPPGAVVLARSAHDPYQAVRFARTAWGVQFHPEFSAGIMRVYLDKPGVANCTRPCCAGRRAAPAPFGPKLLARFGRLSQGAS